MLTLPILMLTMIQERVGRSGIKIMNVAGARASKDPMIYQAVMDLLEKCVPMGEVNP